VKFDLFPVDGGPRLRAYAANLLAAVLGCPGYLDGYAKGWESGRRSGLRKGHQAGLADAAMGVAQSPEGVGRVYQRGYRDGLRAHRAEFGAEATR
jgi:hypothetical protein